MEKKENDAPIVAADSTLAESIATKGKDLLKKVEDKVFEYYDRNEEIDSKYVGKKGRFNGIDIKIRYKDVRGEVKVGTSSNKTYKK